MSSNVHRLNQDHDIEYRGHTIRMKYRTQTNDWAYEITLAAPVLRNHKPRLDAAIKAAKKDIDILMEED